MPLSQITEHEQPCKLHYTTTFATDPLIQITARHSSFLKADPTAARRSSLLSHKLVKAVAIFITASCSRGLGGGSISDFMDYWTDNTVYFHGDILSHIDAGSRQAQELLPDDSQRSEKSSR